MKQIRLIILGIFASIATLAIVHADNLPLLGVGKGAGAPAGYVGPGDIVSGATIFWGLRAYNHTLANAGATTTPIIDVRGSTTATTCTIFLKGDGTGGLDLTTSGAGGVGNQCASGGTTFCTVTNTNCSVSKIYDQSGANACTGSVSCDATQPTVADQPILTFSCIGSLPCLVHTSQWLITVALASSSAQPYVYITVGKQGTSNTGNLIGHGTSPSNAMWDAQTGQSNEAGIYAGTVATTTGGCGSSDCRNVWLAFEALFSGASSKIYINGTNNTVSANTNGLTTQGFAYGSDPSNQSGDSMIGDTEEIGVYETNVSASFTSFCQNQQAYYGSGNFPATC